MRCAMPASSEWIYSQLVSLVNHLASPEPAGVRVMTGTSGPKSLGSFARLARDGSWVKTSRDSEASVQMTLFSAHGESLEMFSGTWPKWGTVLDGVSMGLVMLEPPTRGIEFSSLGTETSGRPLEKSTQVYVTERDKWPTPAARETGRTPEQHMAMREGMGRTGPSSLSVATQMWPTPWANDPEKRGDFDLTNPRNGLPGAVKRWATPAAADSVGSHGGGQGRSLRTDIHNLKQRTCPAPQSRDYRSWDEPESLRQATKQEQGKKWRTPKADENGSIKSPEERVGHNLSLSNQTRGTLNPDWVEALMAFPPGWTAVEYRPARTNRSTTGSRRGSPRPPRKSDTSKSCDQMPASGTESAD